MVHTRNVERQRLLCTAPMCGRTWWLAKINLPGWQSGVLAYMQQLFQWLNWMGMRGQDKKSKFGRMVLATSKVIRVMSDVVGWRKIKCRHSLGYLITRPGAYTLEQLLSWKQLKGCSRYFRGNLVWTIICTKHALPLELCVIKTPINQSQNIPDMQCTCTMDDSKADGTILLQLTLLATLHHGYRWHQTIWVCMEQS